MSRAFPKYEFEILWSEETGDFHHIPKVTDAYFIPMSADILILSRVSRISEWEKRCKKKKKRHLQFEQQKHCKAAALGKLNHPKYSKSALV